MDTYNTPAYAWAALRAQHLNSFTFLHLLPRIQEPSMATSPNTSALLRYLAEDLTADTVPDAVWLRIQDLFLDWLASALASQRTHPIPLFATTARQMGPTQGSSQVLPGASLSSPYWASWVNAAASHTLEQDDLHNSSVMHPATLSPDVP